MKILVTGASGGLAGALIPLLEERGETVVGADVVDRHNRKDFEVLDIADFEGVKKSFERVRPDFTMHLAAATDVDRCEREPDFAYRVNALGTENIALACRKHDIPMLFVSTAEVFDGEKKTPYTEYDTPNPLNVYARSKLAGERAVQSFVNRHYIVRTAWLIAGGRDDQKFVGKMLRLMETEKQIKAVKDKVGSPTFAKDFSKNLIFLVRSQRFGLYHMVNQGSCTRFDMAKKMAQILKKDIKVVPVSSSAFKAPAKRGKSEALSNYKLGLLGLNSMPSWESSMEEYLKSL